MELRKNTLENMERLTTELNPDKKADEIVRDDLNYICESLISEFHKLENNKVLITGGAGFLGYYLVQSMLFNNKSLSEDRKIELTVYDNFIRGVPEWLTSLESDSWLRIVKQDIINPIPSNENGFDYIIHAASIASPIYYRKYPLETMDANVVGLRNILENARIQNQNAQPVKGILFFSTSEIYGDPDSENIPTPETYRGNVSCTGPRACYDESKRYGETLCVTYARKFGLPVTIARPFNNYGPGLKITDRRVIPDFMRDVLEGKNIVMLSDGSPSRTFCYIADAIIGYLKILVNGEPGEPYNIGVSEPEISMKELANKIVGIAQKYSGYRGEVVHKKSSDSNYLVDNPNRRCPVISKAKTALGYNPKIGLDEGLIRNYIWYKENKKAVEA